MEGKKRCVIICASPEFFFEGVHDTDYVIVCDGGYKYAKHCKIKVDLFIGDFDSYSGEVDEGIEVIQAPVAKDDTDALLAVKYAMKDGFKEFLLLGATGGRIDHQIANFNVAAFITNRGGHCEMIDNVNRFYSIKNEKITLKKRPGWSLSVFAHSEVCTGVTLKGVRYPLKDATITNDFPVGVSNEIVEEYAEVEVREGLMFVVESLV